MINIVYAGQFRDSSGYAVAARGYLKSLDTYLQKNPDAFNLKVYTPILAASSRLTGDEIDLLDKYEFNNDEEIEEFTKKEYLILWHFPPPLTLFTDERFPACKNCNPSLIKLLKRADHSVNFVAWETSLIPEEWDEVYGYWQPEKIIVPCEWNKDVFSKNRVNAPCDVVPHIIEEKSEEKKPLNLPINLDNKFVVFSMSQWTSRKGFDKLIQAFSAEFGNSDDVVLVLKTFGSLTHNDEKIRQEIKALRNSILLPGNKKVTQNNILLIPGFISNENIAWLYEKTDLFALLSRGEGFGLTIAEALSQEVPVLVSKEGGHLDYISEEAGFFVEGMWDTCTFSLPPYESDGDWFIPSVKSAREKIREAYNLWKSNRQQLESMGKKGKKHILEGGKYTPLAVGEKMFNSLKEVHERKKESKNPIKEKVLELKKQIQKSGDLESAVKILKDSFKNEECLILATGPSLTERDVAEIKKISKNKLVFTIKQAYDLYEDISDFHFFNCANLPTYESKMLPEHYKCTSDGPIFVASSNYPAGQRWSPYQKYDLFFKIPIRTEINDEFLCKTKKYDDYLLEKTIQRPCGPGIMFETVIYMAVHLGVKKITAIGYDLSSAKTKKAADHKHFYGGTDNLINRGDVLGWEMGANIEASESAYLWLKGRGVELELASDQSVLSDAIPRVKI
tara:strand:+ start:1145 stop:3175 length:2031 start_codon:yes stop_codon:yes gene_type:complete